MEESAFVKTLGDYPLIRILDFLIENREFDYPVTEIARNSNVNFATLKSLWLSLKKILVRTRTVGKAEMYKLNLKNPIVEKLIEFDNFLTEQQTQKILAAQEETVAEPIIINAK